MRHCDYKSDFISKDSGIMFYTAGDMYFRIHEPEASFLTNPKAFPNLSIDHASPELKEWLLRHGKFDNPPKVESDSE